MPECLALFRLLPKSAATDHTMSLRTRLHISLIGLAAAGILSGCAGHEVAATATRPGKFRLFSCDQLDKRGAEVLKRERELSSLMQKARQGPGGEVAIALAYQNEYNIALGDLREIELTAAERNCALKFRTVSERAVQ
jgi:hypothetical protein